MNNENKHHRMDHMECPVCGSSLNATREANGTDDKPSENDISVCEFCTAVMVFDKNIKPRIITDQEFQMIKKINPDLFNELNKIIEIISNKKKLK